MLATTTPSRETGDVRKLVSSSSPSHEPSPAPNDPYGALRVTEGQSRLTEMAAKPPLLRMVGPADYGLRTGRVGVLKPENINAVSAH